MIILFLSVAKVWCYLVRLLGHGNRREPWKQPLLKKGDIMVVEISNLYQVAMLVNDLCRSKSVNDLSSPSCQTHKDDDNNNLEDEDEWQDGKKFDAVATFKILSEVDIAHLS